MPADSFFNALSRFQEARPLSQAITKLKSARSHPVFFYSKKTELHFFCPVQPTRGPISPKFGLGMLT